MDVSRRACGTRPDRHRLVTAAGRLVIAFASGAFSWPAPAREIRMFALASAPLILGAGAVAAIVRPERGLEDRLAGTWIVPR